MQCHGMKAKTKILLGYFCFAFIETVNTWCLCQNKNQQFSIQDDVVENRQDFNKQYVHSDEFRNRNNYQRLPQLPQRDGLEQLPDEYIGNNPLQFHVEANYDEESNLVPGDIRVEKPQIGKPFPINPNWKPRIKNTRLKPSKYGGTKWLPFPMKMPPYVKNPFKHLPEYLTPPWLPKQMFPFHSNSQYKINKQVINNNNNNEDSEEQDFSFSEILDFMKNHGLNHVTEWSKDSDPEQGFKNVKVILPKQMWKEGKN